MNTQISRRWFIGGLASCGALAGCQILTGSKFLPSGKPNLKFGVVSDVHFNACKGIIRSPMTNDIFLKALKWFRAQEVDAVVIAGDMADNGLVGQLQEIADCWFKVFPDDKGSKGQHVERIFVTGNHDMGGEAATRWLKEPNLLGKPEDLFKPETVIANNPQAAWSKVFHEDFVPVYHKVVKGYDFVGAQWHQGWCTGRDETFNDQIPAFYEKMGKKLNPHQPFFHVQHPHPKNTCYGPWAWGHDIGLSTAALSKFPNAVAFSGHSHYSLTDERSIWQGAFTSVGTSTLRYICLPQEDGYPEEMRARIEKSLDLLDWKTQQAMVWSVYDDCMTVTRREVMTELNIGDDWVIPLPSAAQKPFAFVEHAKKFSAPQFIAGAKLEVKAEKDALKLTIPAVKPDKHARGFSFDIAVSTRAKKDVLVKHVSARGYGRSEKDPLAASTSLVELKDLPKELLTITVTPVSCFSKLGKPLTTTYKNA